MHSRMKTTYVRFLSYGSFERSQCVDDALQDDSESEDDVPKRAKGGPKGRGAGAQNVNPEECKQQ